MCESNEDNIGGGALLKVSQSQSEMSTSVRQSNSHQLTDNLKLTLHPTRMLNVTPKER